MGETSSPRPGATAHGRRRADVRPALGIPRSRQRTRTHVAGRDHHVGVAEAAAAAHPGRAFRRELHGLRALAITLVAVYHIWFGRVSGGVDVFLFLSAYLLTGTFVRRIESDRPLAVPRYWLRTFKRLLPPAAVTILAVLVGTTALLPTALWPAVMDQAVASATYWQNLELIRAATDYHQRDAGTASPLQHFWSLSIQGQMFLLWPVLMLLVAPLARRLGVRRSLVVLFAVIGGASFVWSIVSTLHQQPIAYFDTFARVWEFAAGSLLALAMPRLERILGSHRPEDGIAPAHRHLRVGLGWVGIAALLAVGLTIDVTRSFPGWLAAWPLVAAGLVLLAGHSGSRFGADRLLSSRPFAFLGDVSYALYLVHWPLLVLWLAVSDRSRAGWFDGTVLLVASVLLAWLLTTLVDGPIRRSPWLEARWPRAAAAVAISLALVLTASLGWRAALPDHSQPAAPTAAPEPTEKTPTAPPLPPSTAADERVEVLPYGYELDHQWPGLPHDCADRLQPAGSFPHTDCQTLEDSSTSTEKTVVVLGNSHSREFIPALIPYATSQNWQIVNLSMSGCGFTAPSEESPHCSGYHDRAMAYLDQVDADLVLVTASRALPDSEEEILRPGTEDAVQDVLDQGIDVLALRDPPRWEEDQYECAADVVEDGGTPRDADAACGADVSEKLAGTDPLAPLADLRGPGVRTTTVDMTDLICPGGRCLPIIADTYVYMDDNHLSRTYVETVLAPTMTYLLEKDPPV